jgi:hypothetical protein
MSLKRLLELGAVLCAGSPTYLGGWGRRIYWFHDFETTWATRANHTCMHVHIAGGPTEKEIVFLYANTMQKIRFNEDTIYSNTKEHQILRST